jgi:hypothetical protein
MYNSGSSQEELIGMIATCLPDQFTALNVRIESARSCTSNVRNQPTEIHYNSYGFVFLFIRYWTTWHISSQFITSAYAMTGKSWLTQGTNRVTSMNRILA